MLVVFTIHASLKNFHGFEEGNSVEFIMGHISQGSRSLAFSVSMGRIVFEVVCGILSGAKLVFSKCAQL